MVETMQKNLFNNLARKIGIAHKNVMDRKKEFLGSEIIQKKENSVVQQINFELSQLNQNQKSSLFERNSSPFNKDETISK